MANEKRIGYYVDAWGQFKLIWIKDNVTGLWKVEKIRRMKNKEGVKW